MNTAVMTPTAEIARETETPKRKPRKQVRSLEQRGLDAAVRFLTIRGYVPLERKWKCHAGTIDIIARDDDTLILVEVKTRKDNETGFPAETARAEKRAKFEKIALAYLHEFDEVGLSIRFDVIDIVVVAEERACIRHHLAAYNTCC